LRNPYAIPKTTERAAAGIKGIIDPRLLNLTKLSGALWLALRKLIRSAEFIVCKMLDAPKLLVSVSGVVMKSIVSFPFSTLARFTVLKGDIRKDQVETYRFVPTQDPLSQRVATELIYQTARTNYRYEVEMELYVKQVVLGLGYKRI
jgi:hypothetical protein